MKNKKNKNNRFKINSIGIYLLSILLLYVSIAVRTYLNQSADKFAFSLILIFCSGGIGAVIYSIRGFYKNLAKEKFNFDSWVWWYIFRPIIGAVTAVFVYFLIVGGLLSIGSISTVDYSKGLIAYCGLAFLCGFCFTQIAAKIKDVASTIFSRNKVGKGKDEE
jgi:membrane protease YdiL (CAAX protease family)